MATSENWQWCNTLFNLRMCFLNLNKLLGWKLNLLHKLNYCWIAVRNSKLFARLGPGLHARLTTSAVGAWLCGQSVNKVLGTKNRLVKGLKKCLMCSLPGLSDFSLALKPTKASSNLIIVFPGFQIYFLFLLLWTYFFLKEKKKQFSCLTEAAVKFCTCLLDLPQQFPFGSSHFYIWAVKLGTLFPPKHCKHRSS